jgi:hypothetical protein
MNGPSHDLQAAKEDLKRLARDTIAALQDAELIGEIALLERRVFTRPATELFDTAAEGRHGPVRFKPMLELALRHIRDSAASPRPVDERRREIGWALDAAGF